MIKSLFEVALLSVTLLFSSLLSFSQQVNGSAHVSCGAFSTYGITVPGTIVSCSGSWTVSYPNGNTGSSSGCSLPVSWGFTPGTASVTYTGWVTYTPNTTQTGSPTFGGGGMGGGNLSNSNTSEFVNSTISVTVGSGRMPKPNICLLYTSPSPRDA